MRVRQAGACLAFHCRRGSLLQDAFVMVVNRDREGLLGVLLADAVQIELALDFGGFGDVAPWAFASGSAPRNSLSSTCLQSRTQLSQM